jgi:Kef-type K+ transport system membrane component KefB
MNPSGLQVEQTLLALLTQIILILVAARVVGLVFHRLSQPRVCGEIAAGLILGPSLFGKLAPQFFHAVFNPQLDLVISMFSQVGLILLLFLVGLEFDFRHVRVHSKKAFSISLAGIVLPFVLGLISARALQSTISTRIDSRGFALFMATAMSITALPILGRILIEFNLHRTELGALVITAAAVDDATGWIILAIVTAIVRSNFQIMRALLLVSEVAVYAVFMILIARPLLSRWIRNMHLGPDRAISLTNFTIVLVTVFVSAIVTNLIGIFSVLGGFMVGAILYDQHHFRTAISQRLTDFTAAFFLPLFFIYTGLRTDWGTMHGSQAWRLFAVVLLAAFTGKFGGCTIAARITGMSLVDSCCVGVLMNTRGLMELVVANLGLDLGVIPRDIFFMLVMMALISTFMAAPVLRLLIQKSELEAPLSQSEPMTRSTSVPSLQRATYRTATER